MHFVAPDCFLSSSSSSSSSSLLFPFSLKPKAILLKRANVNSASRTQVTRLCRASLLTNPDSFELGRLIGSYGFMNVTSYSGFQSGADLEFSSPGQLRVQDVGEGNVKMRLYEGRIAQGLLKGTPVIFKVYPGQRGGGVEADMMAAKELSGNAFLQSSPRGICKNIPLLLGGFETKNGEQVTEKPTSPFRQIFNSPVCMYTKNSNLPNLLAFRPTRPKKLKKHGNY